MGRERRKWTDEEDFQLRESVNRVIQQGRPLLWHEIAKCVPDRTNKDCRRRWCNTLADNRKKGPWSDSEDERLIEAFQHHGSKWNQVAKSVKTRNSDQCSSHWSQTLDPEINYSDWSAEEDEKLVQGVQLFATNWTKIASAFLPNRTRLSLKNRYSILRSKSDQATGNQQATNGSSSNPMGAQTDLPGPDNFPSNSTEWQNDLRQFENSGDDLLNFDEGSCFDDVLTTSHTTSNGFSTPSFPSQLKSLPQNPDFTQAASGLSDFGTDVSLEDFFNDGNHVIDRNDVAHPDMMKDLLPPSVSHNAAPSVSSSLGNRIASPSITNTSHAQDSSLQPNLNPATKKCYNSEEADISYQMYVDPSCHDSAIFSGQGTPSSSKSTDSENSTRRASIEVECSSKQLSGIVTNLMVLSKSVTVRMKS